MCACVCGILHVEECETASHVSEITRGILLSEESVSFGGDRLVISRG